MASQIDVVNQALILLESDPVTSIDDDTDQAVVMKALWEPSRRFVLRDSDFNFSRTYTDLTADPKAPKYVEDGLELTGFHKPSDEIRVLEVQVDTRPAGLWRSSGRWVYVQAENIGMVYTFDAAIGLWDDAAAECLSYYLAYKAARAITQSNEIRQQQLQDYAIAKDAAKQSSGLEGTSRKLRAEGRLTVVRNSTGGRSIGTL